MKDIKPITREEQQFSSVKSHSGISKSKLDFCGKKLETEEELTMRQNEITGCDVALCIENGKDLAGYDINSFRKVAEKYFKETYENVKEVWIGYDHRKANQPEPIIVIVYEKTEKDVDFPDKFYNVKVQTRQAGIVSGEGKFISKLERERRLCFTEQELFNLRNCLAANTETFMQKHSNIQMIGGSQIKCKGWDSLDQRDIDSQASWDSLRQTGIERQSCIVLYVFIKGIIPFGENPFPKQFGDFPIDVREAFSEKCHAARFDNLIMGCEFETAYGDKGSIGGFVKISKNKIGCITCCHVFISNQTGDYIRQKSTPSKSIKHEVYQPTKSKNNTFGKVIRYINNKRTKDGITVDAALIEITDEERFPEVGRIGITQDGVPSDLYFDSGEIIDNFDQIVPNCKVLKYGAATGLTYGYYQSIMDLPSFSVESQEGNRRKGLLQQLDIWGEKFAQPGDSGSLVFVLEENEGNKKLRALGIVVAITSQDTVIVTPIWAVLEKLGLPNKLYDFSQPISTLKVSHPETQLKIDLEAVKSEIMKIKKDTNRIQNILTDVRLLKKDHKTIKNHLDIVLSKFDNH